MRRHGKLEYGGQAGPQRTCVGCRVRTAKSELLRLVRVEDHVVPDLRGRLPGRGASLHPAMSCLELAERRRAFPRAFRVPGPLDASRVRAHLDREDHDMSCRTPS
ncbi:YlxR family protein [Nonomuraea sp. SMC257]|uniref:YlxR family protein n=1 Tax=Nonomuraea montanisoli TaxID=2741721 RepID=A0A7Y6IEL8_9ACTN|nr:YlxR family protein [Nonomuraea montanisoli]NUW36867.1 YlxR family protein [Nonomuraea montanisoli]